MKKVKKIENTIHHDIFYPSSKEVLEELIKNEELEYKADLKDNNKVVIVPHASYEFILPLLINTFTSIKDDFERVLIIAPSHLNEIEENCQKNIFVPKYDGINTPLGEMEFDNDFINEYFTEDMREDTYFEEEPSFEEVYIMIQHYFKNKKVVPICAIVNSSTESKNFSTFLNKILDEKTLVIISANASAYQNQNLSFKKANALIESLENGDKLLQLQKKNIIHCCASGIIDSILKTQLYKNKSWDVNLVEVEKQIASSIINDDKLNKCVYHIAAKIKD